MARRGSSIGFHLLWHKVELAMSTRLCTFRFDALTELGAFMRTEFLCISVLRITSGPRVKLVSCKSALNPPVVYCEIFENGVLLMYTLEGVLQTSLLLMKSLNKTETPIFLSVVCAMFPKAIFLTFILFY